MTVRLLFLLLILNSCSLKCDKVDSDFKPHIVTHYHKSKVYKYYHTTPCSRCISVTDDLKRDSRNSVEFIK